MTRFVKDAVPALTLGGHVNLKC